MAYLWRNLHSCNYCHGYLLLKKMRINPQQYFLENGNQNNKDFYPILLVVLIGGLITITAIAIAYRK